jgi:hypothetical protein
MGAEAGSLYRPSRHREYDDWTFGHMVWDRVAQSYMGVFALTACNLLVWPFPSRLPRRTLQANS